jgi:hypothetical protein
MIHLLQPGGTQRASYISAPPCTEHPRPEVVDLLPCRGIRSPGCERPVQYKYIRALNSCPDDPYFQCTLSTTILILSFPASGTSWRVAIPQERLCSMEFKPDEIFVDCASVSPRWARVLI